MRKNKKGVTPFVFVGVLVVIVVLVFAFASSANAVGQATSFTPQVVTCNQPILTAEVNGEFAVRDGAFLGVEPEVDRVTRLGIRPVALGIFTTEEPFDWKVELFDKASEVRLSEVIGNAELSSAEDEVKVPFNTFYRIADNNCDGIIDDTELRLVITIQETKELPFGEDSDEFTRDFVVRNGVVI